MNDKSSTSAKGPPPAAVSSATILLLRDDRGPLEVFMVQRHHQIDFATGALVFPGGKTDAGDRDPALRAHCAGAADFDDETLALRISAVRETFEESGVLVARARGEAGLLDEARVRPLETKYRDDLVAGRVSMRELVEANGLELATDVLVHFAHWITPTFMPKRFDTHFYLVPAPTDQVAAHDGEESVDSVWIRPADAIADAEAKRRTIIFPTLSNVMRLGRSATVAEAIARARSEPLVTVQPWVNETAQGKMLMIPPEAGYEINAMPMTAER